MENNRERYTSNPRLEIDITTLVPILITFKLIKGEKYAVVNDFIREGRGFRRPLRRCIERFNRRVFSRFSTPRSGKINSREAREAATRIYIATRVL